MSRKKKRTLDFGDEPDSGDLPFVSDPTSSVEIIPMPGISVKPEPVEVYSEEEIIAILQESGEELEDTTDFSSEEENINEYHIVFMESSTPTLTSSPKPITTHLFLGDQSQIQPEWSPTRPTIPYIAFIGNSGMLKAPLSNKPIDFFFHICTEKFFDLIIMETNNQGNVLISESKKPKARIHDWKPVTREELEVFLGLIFLTGHINVPTLAHYWQINDLYNFPLFRHAMSRDRFCLILRALNFAQNSPNEPKSNDPFFEISPLFDLFHDRMKEIYYPSKQLCLDEYMLLTGGRLVFPEHKINDRHKDIKIYTLTEPDSLVLKTRIYRGANDPILGGPKHADKVAKYLLYDYFGVGHSIYMEEFYSSVALSTYLLEKETYSTGMLKANKKGNPLEIMNKKLENGELASAYNKSGLCVIKWHNKRDILVISSEFGPTLKQKRSRNGKILEKPEAIQKYNEFMRFNRSEQFLSHYPLEGKTIRCHAKVALHFFHIMIYNAYILYKRQVGKGNVKLLDFREKIIHELIYRNRPTYSPSQQSPKDAVHTLSLIGRNESNRLMRKRCVICYKENKRVDSPYFCNQCVHKPGLCMGSCFLKYHKYS